MGTLFSRSAVGALLVFAAIVFGGVFYYRATERPDDYLYSSYRGYELRTNKVTGVRELSSGHGWISEAEATGLASAAPVRMSEEKTPKESRPDLMDIATGKEPVPDTIK